MHMTRTLASLSGIITIGLCVWTLSSPPAQADVLEPIALADRIQALVEALQEHGVAFDADIAYETAAEALISVADPRGGAYTEAAEHARARRRAGTVYDAGVRVAITNDSVRILHLPDHDFENLEVGSTLLKIDQTDVTALGFHRIARLLRSDEDKPVTLVSQTADGFTVTQRVPRVETTLNDVEPGEELPFRLAYLQVNRLHAGTGATIASTISDWAADGRYGVLLDLRGADGEDLDSVKAVAELFAEPGSLLFAYRDKDDQDLIVVHADDTSPLTMPVMVLIDGHTAGAAEVLAAVFSDSVRGVMLFGQPTQGDMLVRNVVTLADGSRLHLATRRLVTADGTAYAGATGVRPDVVAGRGDEDMTMYKPVRSTRTKVVDEEIEQEMLYDRLRGDAVLRRAADVLLGLKALDIRPRGIDPRHTP